MYWNWVPGKAGWPPIWPAATCTFCSRTARQHFIHVHVAGGDLARVEPQAHGVIAGAEHFYIAHAGKPRQHVLDLNDRVIAQVQGVVALVA